MLRCRAHPETALAWGGGVWVTTGALGEATPLQRGHPLQACPTSAQHRCPPVPPNAFLKSVLSHHCWKLKATMSLYQLEELLGEPVAWAVSKGAEGSARGLHLAVQGSSVAPQTGGLTLGWPGEPRGSEGNCLLPTPGIPLGQGFVGRRP